MEQMRVKTLGNATPQGKPKVYFTCHSKDFDTFFDMICSSLFESVDCAVYYTDNMETYDSEDIPATILSQMNLFVIPVSYTLLTTENRTMHVDFPFAVTHNIPVLPIMIEQNLIDLYALPDKFHDLQYLDPYAEDAGALPYAHKLSTFLHSVLLDKEQILAIREAFDASLFLSYRKKDREMANDLMQKIHQIDECRDVAIWYDEYLTPGESFHTGILESLKNCSLFTLLITPNLINEPNYVQSEEYPSARKIGKPILPVEMQATDIDQLRTFFEELPDSVNGFQEKELKSALLENLKSVPLRQNDKDAYHNYLIGLAYLTGTDVEVNQERAISLLQTAAKAEAFEAYHALVQMYTYGIGVDRDYRKAASLAKENYKLSVRKYGEDAEETLRALHNLGAAYSVCGDNRSAKDAFEKVWRKKETLQKTNDPECIPILVNLASIYINLGQYNTALSFAQKGYELARSIYGEDKLETTYALANLAISYTYLGEYRTALTLQKQILALRSAILGEVHRSTLQTRYNITAIYIKLGKFKKAKDSFESVLDIQKERFGHDDPSVILTLHQISTCYLYLKNPLKAIALLEQALDLSIHTLGEYHPFSLHCRSELASAYGEAQNTLKGLGEAQKAYDLSVQILGKEHPSSLTLLNSIAIFYSKLEKEEEANKLFTHIYNCFLKNYGPNHPQTLSARMNLADAINDTGDHALAIQHFENIYHARKKLLGETHPDTLAAGNALASSLYKENRFEESLRYTEEVYDIHTKMFGDTHPDTLKALVNLGISYHTVGRDRTAIILLEKAWKLQQQSVGTYDEITIKTLEALIGCCQAAGETKKALQFFQKLQDCQNV